MSKSPTAVDHHMPNGSPPAWKKDLISRIKFQKGAFIRLPKALLSPPPTANKDSSAIFNRSNSSPGVDSGTVLRLSRDDGVDTGLNGLVKIKPNISTCDAPDGNASLRSKQKAGVSNNEFDVSRAWLSQSNIEVEELDAITATTTAGVSAKRATNEVLRVSDHKRGAVANSGSETSAAFGAFVFGSTSTGLTTPAPTKFLNTKDDASGRKTNLGMGVKSNATVAVQKNDTNSLTVDLSGIDVVSGDDDETSKADRDSDIDYGPGLVGRLREKFKSLALRDESATGVTAPVPPATPVRRVASLEFLDVVFDDEPSDAVSPGITRSGGDGLVGRTKGVYEKNAKHNMASAVQFSRAVSLLKRAKSMDNVTAQERGLVTTPKDYFSKKIIIIEQLKPSETPAVEAKAKETTKKSTLSSKSASSLDRKVSSGNADEYPATNTVREYMKIFEKSENSRVNVGGTTTKIGKPITGNTSSIPPPPKSAPPSLVNVGGTAKIGKQVSSTSSIPPLPISAPPSLNVNKPLLVIEVKEQTLKKEPPKPDIKVPIAEPVTQSTGSSQTPSVKNVIENFSNFRTSKPSYPSANAVETPKIGETQKPIGSIIPFQREPKKPDVVVIEEEPIPPKVPKIVNHSPATIEPPKTLVNGFAGQTKQSSPTSRPVKQGNTVIINFLGKDDGNKPPPPHLPTIEEPVPSYVPQLPKAIVENDASDDDDDDVIVNMQDTKAVNFIGANIIVGRSSLLKSRNKKLQILFDDKAISTYEYPSEWTLLNERSDFEEWEDPNSNYCDINEPNIKPRPAEPAPDYDHVPKKPSINMTATSGGRLDHYTPMALSNEHVFELGMSRAPQPTVNTSSSSQNSTMVNGQVDENAALSLKPAADNEKVPWSSSQTSDLLF